MNIGALDNKNDVLTHLVNTIHTNGRGLSLKVYLISVLGIFFSFLIMSHFNEKSVNIRINGEKFEYPELRLIIGYFCAFVASTIARFITKEKISIKNLLHPIFKNENYIISSILLFFCKF